ncbi:MAG: MarR family transcriptional regulator [Spirochaetes bacterium]|jgi:DNA-binding MarR family transcriptional regulator|nr:MarR family transcriptional regulator [Spirochaetota bacterium]
MVPTEKELEVLEQIYIRRDVRQRDLAQVIGLSLGMTNAILKRLTQKGFLTVRKVNNRNIAYAVSPVGVDAIARKSYRYLKRTIKNVVDYKQAIEDVISAAAEGGYTAVALVGPSDLDFIVEHLCRKCGLGYERIRKVSDLDGVEAAFLLFSENETAPEIDEYHPGPALDLERGFASLQAILVAGTA